MTRKNIVVLATLDTKGLEAGYLREQINSLDCDALLIDVGVVVGEPGTSADISRDEVARAGGSSLEELLKKPDREVAAPIMADGATKLISEMAEAGKIHGIVATGGTPGHNARYPGNACLALRLPQSNGLHHGFRQRRALG